MIPILDASPSGARHGDAIGHDDLASTMAAAREAQRHWAATPLRERLRVLRRLRHLIAQQAEQLAASVPLSIPGSLHRNVADTLVAEVLPLAEACRFLERNAATVLASRHLSPRGRPFFLRGVDAVVERSPWGIVLVLGPANYPLFLPAVQALHALAAGNAVLWKPAATGAAAASQIASLLRQAGLPTHLVTILDTTVHAAAAALCAGVDKVVLTGHTSTGRSVLHSLAETATPSVMELSGCDAVFVLPGADLHHAARAIAFGLRLNGSATCMAPRRLFLVSSEADQFLPVLCKALSTIPPVPLSPQVAAELHALIEDAERAGGRVLHAPTPIDVACLRPVVIKGATPSMLCMRTDIFAPLISIMDCTTERGAAHAYSACPYSLTASVFGPEREATAFGRTVSAGTVLINDIIVATADPRLPFGGRGQSGYGVTRGNEGLLEMTTVRTMVTQHSRGARAYSPTSEAHTPFFSAYIRATHSGTWAQRLSAFGALIKNSRRIPPTPSEKK